MGFADTQTRLILEGIGPVKVSLATAVSRGDPLTISGSQWTLAAADDFGTLAELVAGETGAKDDTITAFLEAVIGNFVSASSLLDLYLSDTAGDYSSATGTVEQRVGGMLASTTARIRPRLRASLAGLETATAAKILVFQGNAAPLAKEVTGDVTISAAGAITIAADAVESSMLNDAVEGIFVMRVGAYATGVVADYAAAPTACVLKSVTFYNKTGAALTSAPVVNIGGAVAATCSTTTLADGLTDRVAASAVTTVAAAATIAFAIGTKGAGVRQVQAAILEFIYKVTDVA